MSNNRTTIEADEQTGSLETELRRANKRYAETAALYRGASMKLTAAESFISENIMRHARILLDDGLSHKLVDLFDPRMSPEEAAAVWTLIQYLKRRQAATASEIGNYPEETHDA